MNNPHQLLNNQPKPIQPSGYGCRNQFSTGKVSNRVTERLSTVAASVRSS